MSWQHRFLFVGIGLGLLLPMATTQASGKKVPHWLLVAVELREHPIDIPDFESLQFSTNQRTNTEGEWLDFSFRESGLSVPKGYTVVATWSSDLHFDKHALKTRKKLSLADLQGLSEGRLKLSIRAVSQGFLRFELWSPRGILIHRSEAKSF